MATSDLGAITNFDGTPEDQKLVQDYKRDADRRHKYALGVNERLLSPNEGGPRDGGRPPKPAQPWPAKMARAAKRSNNKTHHGLAADAKHMGKHRYGVTVDDFLEPSSGDCLSSNDESVREPSPAPDPEAEITYSFDAPRGASQGAEVLSSAVAQAVERFETRETQKLVDREYDVVGKEADDEDGAGYAADDDFELL